MIDIDPAINKTGKAYIDFYLPKLRIAIEYNGRQHYHYTPYFHKSKRAFERQRRRDEAVRKYCTEKNIKLIEIKYSEDVVKVLDTYFS